MLKKLGVLGLALAAAMTAVPSLATAQQWQGHGDSDGYYQGQQGGQFRGDGDRHERERWEREARARALRQQAWREREWRERERRERMYREGYYQQGYYSNPYQGY